MAPTPVFLPREFHGLRSLVGYSPWGRKESDITERLSTLRDFRKIIPTTQGFLHLKDSGESILLKMMLLKKPWIIKCIRKAYFLSLKIALNF